MTVLISDFEFYVREIWLLILLQQIFDTVVVSCHVLARLA